MKNTFTAFLFCYLAVGLFGCNTTAGIGEDIEATGEKITEVAEDAKDEITDDEK